MPLPHTFANQTAPTMPELDDNFAALGALTAIACGVAGTNTLTLSPQSNTPTIAAYANYQPFTGIASATNTAAVTASVGSLGVLNVYKDSASGPIALSGGEIVQGSLVYLTYDSALNSGAGGFHLMRPASAQLGAEATVSAAAGTTLTAAQITGSGSGQGIILRAGAPGAGFNDQLPLATDIVAALPGAVVNTIFRFRVVNTSGQTQTLTTNTGLTLDGTVTTATAATHDFIGRVSNIGTPAVTIYG